MVRRIWFIVAVICSFGLQSTWASGGACPSGVPSGVTSCYFASAAGLDTNSGTSEASPWLHLPGMAGCVNTCNSTTPASGQGFILRGGDTWTNQGWSWTWSGTSGSHIYIGVDQTWYSGSSWARPILNANGTSNASFDFNSVSYVDFDNVEFTGMLYSGSQAQYIEMGTANNISITHSYFHGWTHTGTSDKNCSLIHGDSTNSGTYAAYNVFDGSDTTNGGDSCYAFWNFPNDIYRNYFHAMPNMFVGYLIYFHDNLLDTLTLSFDGTQHGNFFEENSGQGTYIYNNVIRHGSGAGSNVTLWDAPSGSADYIFNNVLYDTTLINTIVLANPLNSNTGGSAAVFNNTEECGPDSDATSPCVRSQGSQLTGGIALKNNHFVTSGTLIDQNGGPVPTQTTNVTETLATANGYGYKMSNGFEPTAGNNPTVGTGTNLTSICNSLPTSGIGPETSPQAACKQSTTFACAYISSNHTVSCPAITPVARPTSGNWDVGAYQFGGGGAPGPPTNLTATPH